MWPFLYGLNPLRLKFKQIVNNTSKRRGDFLKKYLPHLVVLIFVLGVLSGFQMNLSTIETEQKLRTMGHTNLSQMRISPITNQNSTDLPSLVVKHEINGNVVLIECIVTGISFRESARSKQKIGKIAVWIDGKKYKEATSVALIIKGLKPGRHKVILEVVKLNNEPYGLTKKFIVNIPQ